MADDYPSDWNSRRKRIYKRDDFKCQDCGARGGPYGSAELHAHHLVPLSAGGTNELDNLITVCAPCHNSLHSKHSSPTAVSRNKKGYFHKKSEEGINSEVNGCPKCNQWALSVQWYRHGFLKKAKLITCEECRSLFKETVLKTSESSIYKLREVENLDKVPTVYSAISYELKKHRKLGNL